MNSQNEDEFETAQEHFWSGSFGDDYIDRNKSKSLLASNINFFASALKSADAIDSVIEIGANIGMNLKALYSLFPDLDCFGIEINLMATKILAETVPKKNIYKDSIFNFDPKQEWDLVISKGVLIHLAPEKLDIAYEKMFKMSKRYILIAEYYNPTPVSMQYRGNAEKLFKRDFAGELMQKYPALHLQDYGFCYHLDRKFPQDDITWFLLEKKPS